MKTKKRRLIIACLSVFIILILLQLGLLFSGWYNEPARLQKGEALSIGRSSLDGVGAFDLTDWSKLSLAPGFYANDALPFIGMQTQITIVQGALTLIIYEDIPDEPFPIDTDKLREVERKTFTESGEYEWDLSDLEKNHLYTIGFFCDEECLFKISWRMVWRPTRAQLLYEKFLTKLPWFPSKYRLAKPANIE